MKRRVEELLAAAGGQGEEMARKKVRVSDLTG